MRALEDIAWSLARVAVGVLLGAPPVLLVLALAASLGSP